MAQESNTIRASKTITMSILERQFAGAAINLYLYGVLTVQFYIYHTSFSNKPKRHKVAVYVVYVLETVNVVLITYDSGHMFINPSYYPYFSYNVVPWCGAVVVLLTEAIYAYRIQIITKSKYASGLIIVAIVTQSIAIAITIPLRFYFIDIVVWGSISLLIDIFIASIMIWSLKRQVFSSQTKRHITRLVYIIFGTNVLTAISNLFDILSYVVWPVVNLGSMLVLSEIYAISMMVLVNDKIHARRQTSNTTTLQLDVITDTALRQSVMEDLAEGGPSGVHVAH